MMNYNYKKGNLIFDDLNIKNITEEIQTPFYCYSLNYLKDQYSSLDNSINLKDYEICYAVKSNSNQSIIKNFANMGSGADVVSIGEMKRALKANISPNKIVFSGVGKNSNEIRFALENDILMFNVESVSELKKISDEALSQSKKAPIAIRINPDISAGGNEKISTGKAQDKFGISWKDAYEVYEYASTLSGIEIRGIDAHIGSQINQLEPFSHSFDKLKEIHWDQELTIIDGYLVGAGCLTGSGDWQVFPPDPYALCIMDYDFIEYPHNTAEWDASLAKRRAIIYHGWAHEYFHRYQRAFHYELNMGNLDTVDTHVWWIEGAAIVFPNIWLNQSWQNIDLFQGLSFDDVNVEGINLDEWYKNSRKAAQGQSHADDRCNNYMFSKFCLLYTSPSPRD